MSSPERHLQLPEIICIHGQNTKGLVNAFWSADSLVTSVPGSSCLCRPLYKVPMVVTETGQTPQVPQPLPSPNKVQKRPKRQNSLQAAPETVAKALTIDSWSRHHYEIQMVNSQSQSDSSVDSPYSPHYQRLVLPSDMCLPDSVSNTSNSP